MRKFLALLALAVPLAATAAVPPLDDTTRQLTRDIYKQLVEINTTESVGNMTTAAEAMAARRRVAGFPAGDVQVLGPIAEITRQFWPGVPVMPLMATGASDGLFLRNAGIPTYGVSGIFSDINDSRAHGRDERVGVEQFFEGTQFLYTLVKRLAS